MQEFQYIQDILKDWYTPAVINQIPKKSPLYAILKKKVADAGGKRVVIPVQFGFTEAVGARAANNYNLPDAQRNLYDQSYITLKRMYGRVMVDGYSIAAAKGKGGWIDVMTGETKGATNAFALDLDRQLMMDGKGRLAQVNGAVAGQVITVNNAGGITGDTPVTKWFRKGQMLDIYSTAGAQHADSIQVASVDAGAGTITVTGTITSVVSTDWILKEDTFEATASFGSGEFMGIEGVIGTGNAPGTDFQGIDRTTEALWQAYVQGSVGVLDETKIQVILDAIDDRTDGDPVNLALTTKTLRNKLTALMQALRKIETLEFKAGWKAIKYVGGEIELPIMVHKNNPTGYMYFLSLNHLRLYMLKQLTWDDSGGGVQKPVSGKDAYESWFKIYANLGTDCPNAMGKGTGITTA